MKNQIKYILCILLAIVSGSCRDEEKNPLPDFVRSSVPVFIQGDTDTGFINFLDYQASHLSFDVERLGSEEIARVDVHITFNNSQTGESEEIEYAQVSSFPQQFEFTFNELLALFGPNVVTEDTLSLGDSFQVWGNALLADGRYLDGGYSPSVVANDPVILTYNVACASDLAGVYDLTRISGTSTASVLPNQTIIQRGQGYYELPDITMEFFPDTPVRYRFTDFCGNLVADPESEDYGGQVVVFFNSATVDQTTGVITIDLEYVGTSCCGLLGNKLKFIATPK
jgi:hypothetical protein